MRQPVAHSFDNVLAPSAQNFRTAVPPILRVEMAHFHGLAGNAAGLRGCPRFPALRGDKRGHIDQALPPILTRLNIDPSAWEETMQPQGNAFGQAMGQVDHLRLHAKALGQSWVRGLRHAERMYRTA